MIIGVPRERKTLERRVALTPDGAKDLIKRGHTILIETNAGAGSFFSDSEYQEAGCKIIPTLKELWNSSELVVKVKEPHQEEYQYFREDLFLFDYLHLASLPDVTDALLKKGITSIAYELVTHPSGRLPLLEPMSEVAGKLSIINGANYLLSQNGGRGVLMGGAVGAPPAEVVIIGAGIAGQCACGMAVGMGARVTVIDLNFNRLEALQARYGSSVRTVMSSPAVIEQEIQGADLLIGAVLVPGAATPKIITRSGIKKMRKGAVFVDISIDQGGCAETSKPTNLDNPVYVEEGVIHYGVCNMPAQTPRTSTLALTSATLPYIIKLAEEGVMKALKDNESLRDALNTRHGKLTNQAVGKALNINYVTPEEILGA